MSRRDPFREIFRFQGLSDMLEASSAGAGAGSWLPPLDVYETRDVFVVVIDVPGVAKPNLDVTLEAGVLTVRGERRFHTKVSEESFHRVERRFGSFARSVSLPSARVDADRVSAQVSDGVLTIEVPKAAATQARRIDVVETGTIETDAIDAGPESNSSEAETSDT